MRLAWVTDPHLDMLSDDALAAFLDALKERQEDGLVLTGDIAEADTVLPILTRIEETLSVPVWFVLGNHDYYGASIEVQRAKVRRFSRQSRGCHWLPDQRGVSLTEQTMLVGDGGWADGDYGDFMASPMTLNDYRLIKDLVCDDKHELKLRLSRLGREASDRIGTQLESAFETHQNVILATHVPPFVQSCWYEGAATLNTWTPHFTCRAVGERLMDLMDRYPKHRLTVLCGHTHSGGRFVLRQNLEVLTGGATYGKPSCQPPIDVL